MPSSRIKSIFLSLILLSLLAGCSTPFVNPPRPAILTVQAGQGAAAGGTVGLLSSAMGGSVLGATAVGAGIGAGVGSSIMSTHHLLSTLQGYGVQVIQVGDTATIILPSDSVFQFNSATIRPSAAPMLNTVMLLLQRYGAVPITITAYTDNVLSPSSALLLTQRQAKSIAGYLWSNGYPFNLVNPVGKGINNNVATNGNSLGSYANRRVMLTLPVVPMHQPKDVYPGSG